MSEQENKSLDVVSSWLKLSAESKDWKYFNYRQESDFSQLWEIGSGVGERDKTSPLLIDWNGFPDERPPFPKILEFITPLDWALAVAYKQVVANPAAPGLPQLIIVDRCSHRYPGSFAVEMRRALADALPHVKVFSALGDDNEDALAFVQFLQSPPMLVKQPRLGQMQALRQAWIGYTVQSGDHHDLSNLLGPLVLSTGFKDSTLRNGLLKDKSAQALLQKIKWSDMGGGEGDPQDKWFDFAQHAAKIVRDSRVKIILVDDQANQGWLDIVSAAVGAERSDASEASENEIKLFAKSDVVEVHASKSYLAIKSRLEDAGISDKEGLNINGDHRFKFSLTGEGAEILLLDLRLFFNELNEQEEIQYFKWALGVAKNLKHTNFPKMNCDGLERWISEVEMSKSSDWRTTTKYLELLTLLPRILATIDMSLPIVIFSSSGQRQVAELLKSYGNIITVFEKPRFFGYISADIARETQTKFSLALASAVKLLYARKACIDLLNVSTHPTYPIKGGAYNHVEIFIDEDYPDDDDLSKIYVGGCVAIYAGGSKEEAQKNADKFDEALVTAGARYFDDLSVGNKSPRIKPKKSSMKSELESALQDTSAPKFLGVVRLCRKRQLNNEGVAGDMTADNHFRRTLGVLLEIFLFEVLSRLFHNGCSKDNTSTSIFVGTRVKFYAANARAVFEEAKSRLGLSGFSSHEGARENYYLTSMDRGGVFPIIADLHEFRHPRTEITRSIGVMLCYHTPAKKRSHPLYFICRNCKEVVSYIKDNLITTATFDVEAGEIPQNIAEVTGKPDNKEFGFIRPIGASEQSIFYKNRCADFDDAKLGKLVTYGGLVPSKVGTRANDVRLVDEETSRIIKAAMKTTLPRDPICLCVKPDFVPDYRALHYLADEALDKFPSEANSPYGMLKIIFDDKLDEQLESLVAAGRELDNGDIVSALIKASHALHNIQPIGNAGSYILARFPDVLVNITNQDYWRMAQRLCENPDLFITLAGLSEELTDDQVKKIVEDLLREEFAQFLSLSIDIARSSKNKRVCKVSSIPEHVSQEIYAKLFARVGADTWRNCTKPTAP